MANPKPQQATSTTNINDSSQSLSWDNEYDLDMYYDDQYQTKPADTFKSLDFSNVAIYGKGTSITNASDDAKFRHFHQMRLFIDSGQAIHHRAPYAGKTVITCNLPETIQYALNSKWEAPLNFGDATFNLMMQIAGNAISGSKLPSGTLRVSSLRIWTSTDPLTLNLTIPVIDDGDDVSGTNLVEALEILGSLVLPRRGDNAAGFYIPPPSPLSLTLDYGSVSLDPKQQNIPEHYPMATANPARIMLQLGGVLLVDNCIVENVTVQYPNTKAQIMHKYNNERFGVTEGRYLHPLLAIVNLRISTLEALTSDTYGKMLWGRSQADEGKVNADLTKVTEGVNWLINKVNPASKSADTPAPSNPNNYTE